MIRNSNFISKSKLEQYHTVSYEKIKMYPCPEQITSVIFRHIDRPDLHVTSELVQSHFKNSKGSSVKKTVGCGRFLKICRDTMYAKHWEAN